MIRNYRGFTLVELLIVVALITFLAAVAGPRLTEYTVQGANASAAADLRSAAAAEKAFFADWGVYASSSWRGASGQGQTWTSGFSQTGMIAVNSISTSAPRAAIADPGFKITLSDYVGMVINTSGGGGSLTMVAKHASGDRCFGIDSDTRELFWVNAAPRAMCVKGQPSLYVVGWGFSTAPAVKADDYAEGSLVLLPAGNGASLEIFRYRSPKCGS